ncbi:MAG: formylglycine-generating enzyme family protein, partial [Planctomycetota bacterium JB042]
MQLKTALLGLIGTLGLACGEARAHVDPAPAAAAPSSDYKGIRQTSDAASPAERVPPRMKFVPGGSFEVGLSEDDVQALELENPALIKLFAASTPRHEVTLEPYYIGEFEVTNAEWKIFLDATEREPSKDLTENYWIDGEIPSGHEHHPVTFVSFPEVEEYCRWAMVRVPTEHEWTFAARGPDGAIFPWGNEFDEPIPQELQRRPRDAQEAEELEKARNALRRGGNMAWCADSSFKGSREPQRVGTMPAGASPFGLMDVVGNVWEWTSSSYTAYPDYEDIGIKTKASRGKKEKYTAAEYFNSSRRVLKGGAFDSPALALRTDVRQYEEQKAWNQTIGFRVAKSVRPGLDAIGYALGDVGSYQFHEKSAPLAMDAIQAVEVTHYDGEGRISGQQGIVFAPVSDWPKYAKSRESDRDSLKSPLSIGLLITSEPTVYPPLGPGTY